MIRKSSHILAFSQTNAIHNQALFFGVYPPVVGNVGGFTQIFTAYNFKKYPSVFVATTTLITNKHACKLAVCLLRRQFSLHTKNAISSNWVRHVLQIGMNLAIT